MRLACIDGLRKENHSAIKAIREPVEVLVSAERLAASHADRADDGVPLPVLCTPARRAAIVAVLCLLRLNRSTDFIHVIVFIHGTHLHCFMERNNGGE